MKSIVFIRDQNKKLRVVINALCDWEDFDKIVKYLEINHHVKILKSYDGIDARRWIITVDSKQLEIIYNDGYGNYILAPTLDSESLVDAIGKDLEERLGASTKNISNDVYDECKKL